MYRAVKCFLICLAVSVFAARAEDAYDVVLISFESKQQAVKAVHDISGMSIADSKTLVEAVPKAFLIGVSRDLAQKAVTHAEALKCKVEMRLADPAAVAGPVRKFDIVVTKIDPAAKEVAANAVNLLLPKEQQNLDNARKLVESVPFTVLTGQSGVAMEKKVQDLTTAGCTVESVSSGGLETGGQTVVLTKIEPLYKVRVIGVIREHTGKGLAAAKSMVENLPSTVKIKVSKEEAQTIKAALEANKAVVEIRDSGK
jgi:ribosomal protein L7/L12